MVWTGDGRVFFFNPSTKTSIWEKPKELEENVTIDDLLILGPPSENEKEKQTEIEKSESVTAQIDFHKEEPMETAGRIF